MWETSGVGLLSLVGERNKGLSEFVGYKDYNMFEEIQSKKEMSKVYSKVLPLLLSLHCETC